MVNVLYTLVCIDLFPPKLLNAVNQLLFRPGLDLRFQEEFQLMPEVFNGI